MGRRERSIVVLGSEQAGKTCFLAGLGILGEADRESGITVSCREESRGYLTELTQALRNQAWPSATAKGLHHRFTGSIRYRGRDLSVTLLDYSGERFREHFSGGDGMSPEVKEALDQADYLLVALDPQVELADDVATGNAGFDRNRYHERLDSLIEAVNQQRSDRNDERPLRVGALITKADLLPEPLDTPKRAESYVRRVQPVLLERLSGMARGVRVFAVSAVGQIVEADDGTGRCIPAPELEPWGYDHILNWVIGDIRRRRAGQVAVAAVLVVAAAGLVVGGIKGWRIYADAQARTQLAAMERRGVGPEQVLEMEETARSLTEPAYRQKVDEAIERAQSVLANKQSTPRDLEEVELLLRGYQNTGRDYRLADLNGVCGDLRSSREEQDFSLLEQMRTNSSSEEFRNQAMQFLSDYPSSEKRRDVEGWLDDVHRTEMVKAIDGILRTQAIDRKGVESRLAMMREFLADYPNVEDHQGIDEAISVAGRLLAPKDPRGFGLTLGRLGTLEDGEEAHLRLQLLVDKKEVIKVPQTKSARKDWSFEGAKEHKLPWECGQEIRVELWVDPGWFWSERMVASATLSGPFSVAMLDSELKLNGRHDDYYGNFLSGGPVLKAEVAEVEQGDRELLVKWVAPGTGWNALRKPRD